MLEIEKKLLDITNDNILEYVDLLLDNYNTVDNKLFTKYVYNDLTHIYGYIKLYKWNEIIEIAFYEHYSQIDYNFGCGKIFIKKKINLTHKNYNIINKMIDEFILLKDY